MSALHEFHLNPLRRLADQFEPQVRLIVAAIFLVVAYYLALHASFISFLFLLLFLLLTWDYIRNNGVWIAFREFRNGQIEQVRRLLEQVKWPNFLNKEALAYYHWLKGVVDVSDGRLTAAKVHLLVAATGQLRTENDRCLVQCLLAEVALQGGDKQAAQEHLNLARNLEHHPNVDAIISKLSTRL